MKKRKKDYTHNVRFDEDLMNRIEREKEAIERALPGVNVTVSDVIRKSIERGLHLGRGDEEE